MVDGRRDVAEALELVYRRGHRLGVSGGEDPAEGVGRKPCPCRPPAQPALRLRCENSSSRC